METKPISRQRKWQLKKKAEGKCQGCGGRKPAGVAFCLDCRDRNLARIRTRLGINPEGYGTRRKPALAYVKAEKRRKPKL